MGFGGKYAVAFIGFSATILTQSVSDLPNTGFFTLTGCSRLSPSCGTAWDLELPHCTAETLQFIQPVNAGVFSGEGEVSGEGKYEALVLQLRKPFILLKVCG